MMTEATLPIFVELYRYFCGDELEARGLENHFAGILPGLRLQVDAIERRPSKTAHAAMDIGITTAINSIKDPGRQRRSKVAVQARHGALLDATTEPAPHHELSAVTERFHEWQ